MCTANQTRVLLVEDEVLISECVADTLTEQGFIVHTESNANSALCYLSSMPVDVLFTDINLDGDMDGTDLARRARAMRPDLTVVYASGRLKHIDPDVAVPNSVFVAKPYRVDLVGELLTSAVRGALGRVAQRVPA